MNTIYSRTFVVLAFLISVAYGEILTTWSLCEDSEADQCEVHEVRLTPCPEAASNKPCKVKRGTTPRLSFDFTPKFSADKLEQQAYSSSFVDLPMPGMQTDGCKSTTCPLEANQKYTSDYDLFLSPSFPPSSYTVKWRLWNASEEKNECCFVFKVKLTR